MASTLASAPAVRGIRHSSARDATHQVHRAPSIRKDFVPHPQEAALLPSERSASDEQEDHPTERLPQRTAEYRELGLATGLLLHYSQRLQVSPRIPQMESADRPEIFDDARCPKSRRTLISPHTSIVGPVFADCETRNESSSCQSRWRKSCVCPILKIVESPVQACRGRCRFLLSGLFFLRWHFKS